LHGLSFSAIFALSTFNYAGRRSSNIAAQKEIDMTTARDIATKHMDAALAEAKAANVPAASVARVMLEKVVHVYKETRSEEDIAAELVSTSENLAQDEDYMFMRP